MRFRLLREPVTRNRKSLDTRKQFCKNTYSRMYKITNMNTSFSCKCGLTVIISRLYIKNNYTVCPEKSVTLTISGNIPKPQNKLWMLCSDAWDNLHKTHMCLGQGLGVSVQLKKFQNWFRGFGIFSEIVRVTLFRDILVQQHSPHKKR